MWDHLTRREFVAITTAGLLAAVAPARAQSAHEGRLRSRPGRARRAPDAGSHRLELGGDRDGWMHVPTGYRANSPAPFVLALHGAGGSGEYSLRFWRAMADAQGLVVLAPDSRGRTWDGALGGFGPDVDFIDRAMAHVFGRCAVDARRMVVSGFSDGASYALSLGLVNGDVFQKVVAFSPGFIVPAEWHGTPAFFVSHGRADRVLPVDVAGRRVVTQLQRGGYAVRFREFDGGHSIPDAIRDEALTWMLER